jgi:hypothetical protein
VDARSSGLAGLDASVGSLVDQLYPHWRARVWFAAAGSDERAWLKARRRRSGRCSAVGRHEPRSRVRARGCRGRRPAGARCAAVHRRGAG